MHPFGTRPRRDFRKCCSSGGGQVLIIFWWQARTDKKVTLERIVDCPERKNEENFHISYVKCNRTTRCIRANITLTQIVGPQSSVSLKGRVRRCIILSVLWVDEFGRIEMERWGMEVECFYHQAEGSLFVSEQDIGEPMGGNYEEDKYVLPGSPCTFQGPSRMLFNGIFLFKGTYVLNDYFINLDRIPIAFMYGMYNIRFTLSTKNQLVACKDFVISVN